MDQPITITSGQDKKLVVTMAPEVDGGITGWDIELAVKQEIGGAELITKTVGNGITITGLQTFEVVFVPADTADLEGHYIYDIWRITGGHKYPLVQRDNYTPNAFKVTKGVVM